MAEVEGRHPRGGVFMKKAVAMHYVEDSHQDYVTT